MKQRFGIAQCLIGQPKLIIVDEPTAGLDPGERNRFYNLLTEIGENMVVILSTHIVQDVRELCSNMAIINKGKVLYAGPPEESLRAIQGRVWKKRIAKSELEGYAASGKMISNRLVAGQPVIHLLSDERPAEGFVTTEPGLEDVFFGAIQGSHAQSAAQ
jgi:ABC-type multidrug transport system ATPase subunit